MRDTDHQSAVRRAAVAGCPRRPDDAWVGRDLAGPAAAVSAVVPRRGLGIRAEPDWQFPGDEQAEGAAPPWVPAYPDYLFLAFTTATAFSPTDCVPLTARAKMLMMIQALLSLVTMVIVAARAVGELGP
jgi:hypothetical protein